MGMMGIVGIVGIVGMMMFVVMMAMTMCIFFEQVGEMEMYMPCA